MKTKQLLVYNRPLELKNRIDGYGYSWIKGKFPCAVGCGHKRYSGWGSPKCIELILENGWGNGYPSFNAGFHPSGDARGRADGQGSSFLFGSGRLNR